jgi:hypothetical protein
VHRSRDQALGARSTRWSGLPRSGAGPGCRDRVRDRRRGAFVEGQRYVSSTPSPPTCRKPCGRHDPPDHPQPGRLSHHPDLPRSRGALWWGGLPARGRGRRLSANEQTTVPPDRATDPEAHTAPRTTDQDPLTSHPTRPTRLRSQSRPPTRQPAAGPGVPNPRPSRRPRARRVQRQHHLRAHPRRARSSA